MTRKSIIWGFIALLAILTPAILAPSDEAPLLNWIGLLGTSVGVAAIAGVISKYYADQAQQEDKR